MLTYAINLKKSMIKQNDRWAYFKGCLMVYMPKSNNGDDGDEGGYIAHTFGDAIELLEETLDMDKGNLHLLRMIEDEIEKMLPTENDFLPALNHNDSEDD